MVYQIPQILYLPIKQPLSAITRPRMFPVSQVFAYYNTTSAKDGFEGLGFNRQNARKI